MKKKKSANKSIAFILTLAMLISSIGLVYPDTAYAGGISPIQEAVEQTLEEYYGTQEEYVLDDWEEMAAVKASGGDLEDFILPATETGTASKTLLSALLKGDLEIALAKATELVDAAQLVDEDDAYKYALNIIAIEAYNRSKAEEDKIVYSTQSAIENLLAFRTNNIFLDLWNNQPSGDAAGLALVALSLFSGDGGTVDQGIADAVLQIKAMQNDSGAFEGAWGFGTVDANTTAVIIWGIMAADSANIYNYKTIDSTNTPVDGLLSFYLPEGGFFYNQDNTSSVNAYATKQAALAAADILNGNSYLANISMSNTSYISAEAQVIDGAGEFYNKKITLGDEKTLEKVIQKTLITSAAINYSDYNFYLNGELTASPEAITISENDKILAVSSNFTKVAYFKETEASEMSDNKKTLGFEESIDLTLTEKTLETGEEALLANKPISYGTSLASNYGSTNGQGVVNITPVEASIEYQITAKRFAWDFYTSSMFQYIDDNTAIIPYILDMEQGTPQTATVSVRVEGPSSNITYLPSFTAARSDGSRLTVFDAVTQTLEHEGIIYEETNKYISSINNIAAGSFGTVNHYDGWLYTIIEPDYLDGTKSVSGMGTQFISGGEEIVVYYGNDDMTTRYPLITSKINSNGSVELQIKNYETDWNTYETNLVPLEGVSISWEYTSEEAVLLYTSITDNDGKVIIPAVYASTGNHSLQISKGEENLPDIIRLSPNYTIGISASGTTGGSGEVVAPVVAYLAVKGPYGYLKSRKAYTWYDGMTALSILQSSGLSLRVESSGSYVRSVEGIGEFDLGANSGWLYSVNGVTPPTKAANSFKISPKDNVLWYYTLDFTKDTSSNAWVPEEVATEEAITVTEEAIITKVTFRDIEKHWAREYIEYLAGMKIIKGMNENEFNPNGKITRAQFVTLLAGVAGVDLNQYSQSQFGDVVQNSWYLGAVSWAAENNITKGYSGENGTTNFAPEKTISRQDMAVMIERFIENIEKTKLEKNDKKIIFADERNTSVYAKEAVERLQMAGLINGKNLNDGQINFDPLGNLTRAEAAKIIVSYIKMK